MSAVHQFHPVLAPDDAMSDHVFALRARFREWGYDSQAYAVEAKDGVDGETRSYRELFRTMRPDDTLVLHFSMGHEVFDELAKLPARRVLVFHNVTPPEFFVGINPHAAAHARLGLRELAAAGYTKTACVPILIDWTRYVVDPDPEVRGLLAGVHSKLLFVGRISPNKRQDELIRMLAYYRRCIDPEAILVLVGSHRDQPQYYARLRALADALGLSHAVRFTGRITLAQLVAYYRAASCFVSLSEHEGVGVPLLEAMHLGTPVVALARAAIPETVGGAGVLIPEKDLAMTAEACALVNEDLGWRGALIDAGHARVKVFDPDRIAKRTKEVLGL